jgi:hypothetical protein
MVCGAGNFKVVGVALVLILLLLVAGGPIEHWLHRHWGDDDDKPPR